MKNNKMKKIILLLSVVAFVGLVSCDSNKSKVKDLTTQFAAAVKNGDEATVYDIYPDAKKVSNMSLPDSIELADIEVEKDDKSGNYIAAIKNKLSQKFVFKLVDDKTLQISNSFGFFKRDSIHNQLAIKTGVPLKRLSDMELDSLLKDDGPYISYIKKKYSEAIKVKISSVRKNYYYYHYSAQVEQTIRNDGKFPVKGEDYDVVFTWIDRSGDCATAINVFKGVDLTPGQMYSYYLSPGGFEFAALGGTLDWKVKFIQKGGRTLVHLLQNAKLTGNEYDEFIQQKDKAESRKQKAETKNDKESGKSKK